MMTVHMALKTTERLESPLRSSRPFQKPTWARVDARRQAGVEARRQAEVDALRRRARGGRGRRGTGGRRGAGGRLLSHEAEAGAWGGGGGGGGHVVLEGEHVEEHVQQPDGLLRVRAGARVSTASIGGADQ